MYNKKDNNKKKEKWQKYQFLLLSVCNFQSLTPLLFAMCQDFFFGSLISQDMFSFSSLNISLGETQVEIFREFVGDLHCPFLRRARLFDLQQVLRSFLSLSGLARDARDCCSFTKLSQRDILQPVQGSRSVGTERGRARGMVVRMLFIRDFRKYLLEILVQYQVSN